MWMKFRHKVAFAILRPVFRVYLRIKYNFRAKKYKLPKGPSLILFNHQTNLDPIMVALSFTGPIYFMAGVDLFTIPFASRIIRYLVAPIPKSKSVRDVSAVRTCMNITKNGGRISLSPEGNRNYSGRLENIDKAIVKFVRMMNVPLVLYTIKGGYGTNPRFSTTLRKGKMTGEVGRILTVEEVKGYSDEELYEIIVDGLSVDDVALNQKFKGKARAEHLESVFYVCPSCGDFSSMKSHKHNLECTTCDLEVEYTEELKFKPINKEFKFETVYDYYEYQKEVISQVNINNFHFEDADVTLYETFTNRQKEEVMIGRLKLGIGGLELINDKLHRLIDLNSIVSLTVVYHNTLIINMENERYHVKGDDRFNALKYVHLFYHIKNTKQGVQNGFLGF